jgi:alpha-mannosidase
VSWLPQDERGEDSCCRISLLRSATAPDAEQDMGVHDFSFAIMPHLNRMQESGVYLEAMKYINPVRGK